MKKAIFLSQQGCDPFYNMACDEWLLGQACDYPGRLYLRLYRWSRPAITFGLNQDHRRAFVASRLGDTPVIRRITGGRALYHDETEFTYSVAVNLDGWRNRRWSIPTKFFRVIAEGLTCFITALGYPAKYCRNSAVSNSHPDFFHVAACFASRARYEIVSGDSKIVASAARKIGSTILQHGAIKLAGVSHHPALPGLDVSSEKSNPIVLQSLKGPERERIDHLFRQSMASVLEVSFASGEITEEENSVIHRAALMIKQSPINRKNHCTTMRVEQSNN